MSSMKKIAQRQDKRVSKKTGLRIRANSGAVAGHRGDLGGPDLFVETKTGYAKPGTLHFDKEWIKKVRQQAFSMGKPYWAIVIDPGVGEDYVLTELKQLISLGASIPVSEDSSLWDDYLKSKSISLSALDTSLYRALISGAFPMVQISYKDGSTPLAITYLDNYIELYNKERAQYVQDPRLH